LKRKNPYLFRAKNLATAQEVVQAVVDAFLSSQEEGLFGGFLEGLAIAACAHVFNGVKSTAAGVDLDFTRDGVRYLVAIKSGPNWGNSQQVARLRDNFRTARRILRTNARRAAVECVNGCCYGNERRDADDYMKICGAEFWELVTGEPEFYVDIIQPLGRQVERRDDEFRQAYAAAINQFTQQFIAEYCRPNGEIDWPKIVKLCCKRD
jgi:hypothetical protein